MRIYLTLTLGCFFSLCLITVKAQHSNLYFEHFNNIDGLSNNRVNTIIQSSDGYLWIGTLDGLNRYDGYNFKAFKSSPENVNENNLHNNRILKIYEDRKGNIWFGANTHSGIEYYNPHTGKFRYFPLLKELGSNLSSLDLKAFKEENDTLYIKMDGAVFQFNEKQDSITHSTNDPFEPTDTLINYYTQSIFKTHSKQTEVLCHLQEKDGTTWIGTRRNGLFIEQNGELRQYTHPPFDASFEIRCLYQDRFGVIWIGTRNNGLYKHYPPTRAFEHYNNFEQGNKLIYDITVRAVTEDKSGSIWIGTYNNGILKFNRQTGKFKHIYLGKNSTDTQNKIRSLFTDTDGKIWVGTYNGITVLDEQHQKSFAIESESNQATQPYTSDKLYGPRIYGITHDAFNNIWIAGWNALSCYNKSTGLFRHYPASFFGIRNIRKVYVDRNNTIWVGAEFGGLVQFNAVNESFERFYPGKTENNLVCENVFDIYEANEDSVWISTFNGLDLYSHKTKTFQHFYTSHGLGSNMIYGILQDDNSNLWFTTTNGITRWNHQSGKFQSFDAKSGLMTNEFAEGGFYKSKKTGEFIIGGINGFQIFHPDSIHTNLIPPQVSLNNVRIMNHLKHPDANFRIPEHQTIQPYDATLTLTPKDKIVTFEFSVLHFAIPERNGYQYKLEGFDQDWVSVNAMQRSATYTNLWPGNYTFKIRGANYDGVQSTSTYLLNIKVLPPFWLKWWAFLIYAAFIALALLLYRYYTLKRAALKNALEMEKMKVEEAEQLSISKMNFFTNISHEFRTPLTLIMAPLDKIMEASQNTPLKNFYPHLKSIKNNANHLLGLTNEVMDLRKIESGMQNLRVSRINITDFVEKTVQQFRDEAIHKNIRLDCQLEYPAIHAILDVQMFEKILNNIISNALKFSINPKGHVRVHLSSSAEKNIPVHDHCIGELNTETFFELKVEDNGIGIPSELIHKVFHRFYRVDNDKTSGIYGSGVGLSLMKELVLLHKGQIFVQSKENEGSTFIIRLPLEQPDLAIQPESSTATHAFPSTKKFKAPKPLVTSSLVDGETEAIPEGAKTLLIADDNAELLHYLIQIFQKQFHILKALDGKTALNLAFAKKPDIIISDIAMPGTTGLELCKRVKNDLRTCHIPIILLTAKTTIENRLESYKALADEYFEKPFNEVLLKHSVQKLIQNRDKIQEALTDGKLLEHNAPLPVLKSTDNKFLSNLDDYLAQNISDVALNVETLSIKLGISRSSLHGKLKTLTGYSASEYIRYKRIKKAAELLKERKHSVLEVSDLTGFNSPSYFIKCFKDKFGVTPKEYMEEGMVQR